MAAPTDTVYGLVADATNPQAVERLFLAKGRERLKAVSVFLERVEDIPLICRVNHWANLFAQCLLPGPYTVVLPVLPEREQNPPLVPALYPQETIGIRVVSHPVIQGLLRRVKRPLTATSANPSGMPPATSAEELSPGLLEEIDGVVEGGRTAGGSSTVVSFAGGPPVVLREGRGIEAFRRWHEEEL